jgi:hypothetical protein
VAEATFGGSDASGASNMGVYGLRHAAALYILRNFAAVQTLFALVEPRSRP